MAGQSPVVRITAEAKQRLNDLVAVLGGTAGQVVERALNELAERVAAEDEEVRTALQALERARSRRKKPQ